MEGHEGKPNRVDASKGALFVLFLVTMIDMIGFGIVILYQPVMTGGGASTMPTTWSNNGSVLSLATALGSWFWKLQLKSDSVMRECGWMIFSASSGCLMWLNDCFCCS